LNLQDGDEGQEEDSCPAKGECALFFIEHLRGIGKNSMLMVAE